MAGAGDRGVPVPIKSHRAHRVNGDEDDGAIVVAPQACFEMELHENGVAAVDYNCSGEPKRRAGVWAAFAEEMLR